MAELFRDNFTGSDNDPIGGRTPSTAGVSWTLAGGLAGDGAINASNQVKVVTTGTQGGGYLTDDLGSPDHWAEGRFLSSASSLSFIAIGMQDRGNFAAGIRIMAGPNLGVWRRSAFTLTQIVDLGPIGSFDVNDVWRLHRAGTTGQVYRNGVPFGSPFSVTTFGTRQTAGIVARSGPTDPFIDDFAAGDLSGGSPGDWALSAALTGAPGVLAATGQHTRPDWAMTTALTGAPGQLSASGSHTPPGASLTAALVGAPGALSATGEHARPNWTLTAAMAGVPGQISVAGIHSRPGWTLTAAMTGAAGQISAAASHAPPGASLTVALVGAPGVLSASGQHTRPNWTLTAAVVGVAGQLSASGSHTPPGPSLTAALRGAPGQLSVVAEHGPPPSVVPGSGAAVVAALSLARLLQAEFRLLPLLTLTMEMDGKPMTTTLRPIAGEEMELRLRVRTPAGAVVAAGGIAITAKPPGGGPVRTYAAVAAGIGDWTATVLFDVPGRWWVGGTCQTPSRAIAEFPVEVQPRAVS